MEILKNTPKWLIILLVFYVAVMFTYAIVDGRRVNFWPPSIGEKENSSPISFIKDASANAIETTSPQDFIIKLPLDVQRLTIKGTSDVILKRLTLISKQKLEIDSLNSKVKVIEGLESDFIFRMLSFHKEASCYGDSLNFTYITNNVRTSKCTEKMMLAKRFLGFMAEINFYEGNIVENPELAESELKRYQDSKEFGRQGYYGRDVFKWIIIDYNGKV